MGKQAEPGGSQPTGDMFQAKRERLLALGMERLSWPEWEGWKAAAWVEVCSGGRGVQLSCPNRQESEGGKTGDVCCAQELGVREREGGVQMTPLSRPGTGLAGARCDKVQALYR